MLKKRLIGVVTVKDHWAVQSFGYSRYLPLGKPECLVENLGRWGADEVFVQAIDRSRAGMGPDFRMLDKIGKAGLGTPLIYAGGIRSVEEGVEVIQRGADRICVDALLRDNPDAVRALSEKLGAQAVIASIPVANGTNGPEWLNYKSMTSEPIGGSLRELIGERVVSEILIVDWRHEGHPESFDASLVESFPLKAVPLIAFGGISSARQIKSLLGRPNVAAVSVGNFLSYEEHAIQALKQEVGIAALRPANFEGGHSLLSHG